MQEPVIEGNYKVAGYTRFISIVEHEYNRIQWVCSPSISTDYGDTDTLKEAMTRPNGNLWKMSAISEVKNICQERYGF